MRILICGSREWADPRIIQVVIDGFIAETLETNLYVDEDVVVIHGAAPGADQIAGQYAEAIVQHDGAGIPMYVEAFPADWETHGKAAGPIRNQRMLDEGKPDVVVAFKDEFGMERAYGRDGKVTVKGGTEDCVRRAKAAGIPVYVISHG